MKRTIIILCCIALGMFVFWHSLSKRTASISRERTIPTHVDTPNPTPSSNVQPANLQETTTAASQDPRAQMEQFAKAAGLPLNVLTQEARLQMSNLVVEMSQTVNRPIQFFGKVTDQHENAIASATVHIGCVVYPDGYLQTNILTDDRGFFEVDNMTGAVLTVLLEKSGYLSESTNQTSFTFYSPGGLREFSPDSNNPVLFLMEKTQ